MKFSKQVWDQLTTVIELNSKVVQLAETVKMQQATIERLAERVVRLEVQRERPGLPAGRKKLSD